MSTSQPRTGVIIAAAGSGTRLGRGSKALVRLNGRTALARVVELFLGLPEIDQIVVVGPPALLELARSPHGASLPPAGRRAVADRAIELQVLRGLSDHVAAMQSRNLVPNHESSILKLFHTELSVRMAATAMQVIGPYGML